MFASILSLPLEARCALLLVVGIALGSVVNLAIYALAWDARAISPWSRLPTNSKLARRTWLDAVPLLGWLQLRRETSQWGKGFWVRPLILEIVTGVGLALLYYWEVKGQLIPLPPWTLPNNFPPLTAIVHARFISHALLILLMLIATFIDFDEKTIPVWITDPGTIVGLVLATIWPFSLPTSLAYGPAPAHGVSYDLLWLTAPNDWSPSLNGTQGLWIGLACYLGWCFAILEKRWITRHGLRKAVSYFCASIVRPHGNWKIIAALVVIGSGLIALVWSRGGQSWQGLLTSLVGMAAGGGLVWAIRIIGSSSLGREAMGFGDVTLMAMIGAFVGWQGALIAFFVAPFAALGIALLQWLITRRHELAFGPYLCAGGLYVLLRWPEAWEDPFGLRGHFGLGLIIPAIVVFCLGLMWLMLTGLRMFREGFGREEVS